MANFENKVVWITGASSGIGEAFAYAFAAEKAKLILSARRKEELERVKQRCNLPDENIMVLPMDVAELDRIEVLTQQVVSRFGQIDILVNNAGLSHWSKLKDTSLDVIKRIMDVNFMGGVALTKAVLPDMLKRKQGSIVVISSILGKIVTAKQGAYNSSKHALHGFYDTLRAETATDGIQVMLVCPGFVNTNVAKNSLDRTGNPIGKNNKMIENGIDPGDLARKVIRALRDGKEEVLLAGTKEKMGVWLKRFAPGLFSKYIRNNKLA